MYLLLGIIGIITQQITFTYGQQPQVTLTILPELPKLYLIKGSDLKIDCIYSRPDTSIPTSVDFYHDGNLIVHGENGFGLQTTMQSEIMSPADTLTSTITLTKNNTGVSDRGEYKCQLGSPNTNSKIDVEIFEDAGASSTSVGTSPGNWLAAHRAVLTLVNQVGDTYVEGMASLNLLCEIKGGVTPDVDRSISWMRDSKPITASGDKYKIHTNNSTLEIVNPERKDMGEYICEIVFLPGKKEEHIVRTKPIIVKAPPAIDDHSKSKNMVQGEDLELHCEVSGYPAPTITWFKDDMPFNTSTRIHLMEYKGMPAGQLTIYSLDFDDKGKYSCLATSSDPNFANNTATADINIRVKDKLAALWPFLGIVAEVIVLCAIILIYEKKKSKQMADEDDSPDTNLDEKKDHKDVRHRRT